MDSSSLANNSKDSWGGGRGGKLSCFWMVTYNIKICKASINTEKEIHKNSKTIIEGS